MDVCASQQHEQQGYHSLATLGVSLYTCWLYVPCENIDSTELWSQGVGVPDLRSETLVPHGNAICAPYRNKALNVA